MKKLDNIDLQVLTILYNDADVSEEINLDTRYRHVIRCSDFTER